MNEITPPPTSEIRAVIETLKTADLARLSVDALKDMLTPLFRGYRVRVPQFEPGVTLYRGRLGRRATHVSIVTYPPPEKATLQRASRETEPLFYAATAREAVFFELNPQPGDTLWISRWRTTHPMTLNVCGFTADIFRRLQANRGPAALRRIRGRRTVRVASSAK